MESTPLQRRIDRLFEESDARIHAVLHKIANLAIQEEPLSQMGPFKGYIQDVAPSSDVPPTGRHNNHS